MPVIDTLNLSDPDDSTDARLVAMALDIERRDEIIVDLQDQIQQERDRVKDLQSQLGRLHAEIMLRQPRLKPDYAMPNPPMTHCGEPMRLTAHNTGDGWHVSWECAAEGCVDYDAEGIDWWPFESEVAWDSDWESIGVEVV